MAPSGHPSFFLPSQNPSEQISGRLPATLFCSCSLMRRQASAHVMQRTGFKVRGTPKGSSQIRLRTLLQKLCGEVVPQMPQLRGKPLVQSRQ